MNGTLIMRFITTVSHVHVEEQLLAYIRDLIIATRNHGDIHIGASSRASIGLVRGSKALAALRERSYVIPDDIKWLAPRVLAHRIILTREAEISDISPGQIVEEILERIEVP